jgi:hypothetical protein
MMTSQTWEVIFAFLSVTIIASSLTEVEEGTAMLNQMKEEEFVRMPLHLQIVCLLELWGKGDDGVKLGFDQIKG